MPDMDQRINFQAQENATKMIGYIKKGRRNDAYIHHGGSKSIKGLFCNSNTR